MDQLSPDNLDNLVTRIKNGDCVLFLGPDILRTDANTTLYSSFSRSKSDQMKQAGIPYDETQGENIYYTMGRYVNGLTTLEVQKRQIISTNLNSEKKAFARMLQSTMQSNPLLDKLAELSFYLTINTNPDDLFSRIQQASPAGNKSSFWYYDFSKENNELLAEKNLPLEINASNTVVYNVYGHATPERANSLPLNESEFVHYSRKVNLPGNGMPATVKNFITNDKVCLFLGFQHDSWPLKILLQSLGFTNGIPRQNISFVYKTVAQYQREFYEDEMKFIFIDSNIDQFVSTLVAKYKGEDIRKVVTVQPTKPLTAVFISTTFSTSEDAKMDIKIRDKISTNLMTLQRKGFVHLWAEDKIQASNDRAKIIAEKYDAADLFIVLGSDLLLSDELHPKLQAALDRVQNDPDKRIVPVYARYFLYEKVPGIDPLHWIPRRDGTAYPIVDAGNNIDKASTEVSQFIENLVTTLILKKSNG